MNNILDSFLRAKNDLQMELEKLGIGEFANANISDYRNARWGVHTLGNSSYVCVELTLGTGPWARGPSLDEAHWLTQGAEDLMFETMIDFHSKDLLIYCASNRDDSAVIW